MFTTLIGPELENICKLAKDKNINKEKETEESKVDNIEEDQAYITPTKKKNEKVNAYITFTKNNNDTVKK